MTPSNFDLISFIEGWIARLRFGRMRRIAWDGATGGTVERLLRRFGIHVYGRRLESKEVRSALVVERQADWATDILWKAGIACVQGDRRAGKRDGWSQELPQAWGVKRSRTVIEAIYDVIAGVVGAGEPTPRRQPRQRQQVQRRKERY